ncbi:efflux RND transporter periplasmic adaptor subunit [Magnetococcales bacterium HHB-1]
MIKTAKPLIYLCLSITLMGVDGLFNLAWAATTKVWPDHSKGVHVQLVSRHQAQLSAELAAKIAKVTVREGDHFKKGDLLLRLKCHIIKAQYQKAVAIMETAQAKHRNSVRLAKLRSISQYEVDLARGEMKQAQADVKIRKHTLSMCSIYAPFSGRVAKLNVLPHQYVRAGQALIKIVDHRHLEVNLLAPPDQISKIKIGDKITVRINETKKAYTAILTHQSAEVDNKQHTVKMIAKIKGGHTELLPGMTGIAYATR